MGNENIQGNIVEQIMEITKGGSSFVRFITKDNQKLEDTVVKAIIFNALFNLYKKQYSRNDFSEEPLNKKNLIETCTMTYFIKESQFNKEKYTDSFEELGLDKKILLEEKPDIYKMVENDTELLFKEMKNKEITDLDELYYTQVFQNENDNKALDDFACLRMNLKELNSKIKEIKFRDSHFTYIRKILDSSDINIFALNTLLENKSFNTSIEAKEVDISYKNASAPPLSSGEKSVIKAMDEGRVWVRSIMNPHLLTTETQERNNRLYSIIPILVQRNEPMAKIEFRKVLRAKDIPTLAQEENTNSLVRLRNTYKFVTKPGYGYALFDEVGYGIIKNFDTKVHPTRDIIKVSRSPMNLQFGGDLSLVNRDEKSRIETKLRELDQYLKEGVFSKSNSNTYTTYNETIMKINKEDVNFIFYYNGDTFKKSSQNIYQKQLIAIYTSKTFRKEALKSYNYIKGYLSKNNNMDLKDTLNEYKELSNKELPIFEYSQNSMYPKLQQYNKEDIVELATKDFCDFVMEHFEILEKPCPFSQTDQSDKFLRTTIVDKYMENEYIKILSQDEKEIIKDKITQMNIIMAKEFIEKNKHLDHVVFKILSRLVDLTGHLDAYSSEKDVASDTKVISQSAMDVDESFSSVTSSSRNFAAASSRDIDLATVASISRFVSPSNIEIESGNSEVSSNRDIALGINNASASFKDLELGTVDASTNVHVLSIKNIFASTRKIFASRKDFFAKKDGFASKTKENSSSTNDFSPNI